MAIGQRGGTNAANDRTIKRTVTPVVSHTTTSLQLSSKQWVLRRNPGCHPVRHDRRSHRCNVRLSLRLHGQLFGVVRSELPAIPGRLTDRRIGIWGCFGRRTHCLAFPLSEPKQRGPSGLASLFCSRSATNPAHFSGRVFVDPVWIPLPEGACHGRKAGLGNDGWWLND
ncbi:hypothetical protein LZ30DRAFT_286132 [Colletotrichum cereale]|nr:hypothetical protein LZ30DRAFT_286132 [Colletotrichum cereale]